MPVWHGEARVESLRTNSAPWRLLSQRAVESPLNLHRQHQILCAAHSKIRGEAR